MIDIGNTVMVIVILTITEITPIGGNYARKTKEKKSSSKTNI